MKTVAVFFSRPDTNDYPLDEDYYRTAYAELSRLLEKRDVRLVFVRSMQTYEGNGIFSKYWFLDGDIFRMVEEAITPDLIYNKGNFHSEEKSLPLLNDPELDRVCLDKNETYKLFRDACPRTEVASSAEEARSLSDAFPARMIVAKPVDGEEGKGVLIGPKEDILPQIPSYPYLLQEFVDTSGGIPGIINGMHDLRMTIIDGEICNSFLRIPAEGKFVSNLAQGGSKQEIHPAQLPKEATELAALVDAEFTRFPHRIYSVDCGRDVSGKWYIIELNSQPGVTCSEEGPISVNFQHRLADALAA